jgi:hypothetical protein
MSSLSTRHTREAWIACVKDRPSVVMKPVHQLIWTKLCRHVESAMEHSSTTGTLAS